MADGTCEYKKLEGMLKEIDQKREQDLVRVEGRLDATLEEIKALINDTTLKKNEIQNQIAKQDGGVQRGSILGRPLGVQGRSQDFVTT